MTQQSAVLLIAFFVGLVVAAGLLRAATRNILPRSAMAIADWEPQDGISWLQARHISDASQLTIAQSEVKKVVITLHGTKRRTV